MRYATSTTVAGRSPHGRTMVMTVVREKTGERAPRPSPAPAAADERGPPCTARCGYREGGTCGFFPADRVKVGDPCRKW